MDSLSDMRSKMADGDYISALAQLKRNPMMTISDEDARAFLNNLALLVPEADASTNLNTYQQNMIETSSFVYKRCERQNVFRGFGSAEKDAYPLSSMNEVTPQRLEELTGLNVASLTPKQRGLYWQAAGIAVCGAEYLLGTAIGVDPLLTFIPLTFAGLAIDQIFYKGAFAESIYQAVFPEYKQKIIYHEAGHFLLAYLLGIPVRGIVTNAMDARKYPDIRGSAGTIFFDSKLAEEIDAQKVSRGSIDRLSIVIMAGIAAEAIKFDRAEGGVSDEQSLTGFLSSVQPPWSITRIQGQARWAVSQAILLIKEHQASYDALVKMLQEGRGVGDAVLAIEANLPSILPTAQRMQERINKRKKRDMEALMRFVQRRIYRAGGIAPGPASAPGPLGADSAALSSLSTVSGEANAPAVTPVDGAAPAAASDKMAILDAQEESRVKIDEFAERMRLLETAVKRQDLDIEKLTCGGIWLNDLRSLGGDEKDARGGGGGWERGNGVVVTPLGKTVVLPPPLPGYDVAVEKLARADGLIAADGTDRAAVADNVGEAGPSRLPSPSAIELLTSHRGYQFKELELAEAESKRKVRG